MPLVGLSTRRLTLLALERNELHMVLHDRAALESLLGFPVSRTVCTETVKRAIGIKLSKMAKASVYDHPWYTYWLITVQDEQEKPFGAGLIGFKGAPDFIGRVEIGYGMDPDFQGKGYVSEAVRGLLDWAFHSPACQAVLAETLKDNLASIRVLERVGFKRIGEAGDNYNWVMDVVRWVKIKNGEEVGL